jgi:[lysine-biosynthesis-protein LysW]--L-2-aminoadipate ligase
VTVKIGVLCSRIRVEEKLLFEALTARGVTYEVIDEARLRFDLSDRQRNGFEAVLARCADAWRAAYAIKLLENMGLRCVNPYGVAETCSNKLLTSAALAEAGVPHPRTMVAFEPEEALAAAETLGYPVVFKPAVGVWEHLLGKVNDRQAAEAVLEHKEVLGTYHHTIFYVQEFIAKPDRDIRVFVSGNRVVTAVYRQASHWSVSTAKDVTLAPCPVTPSLEALALRAAAAVGGGVLTVDLIEDGQHGPLVIEVAPVQEFRRVSAVTGVDIARAIIDAVIDVAAGLTTLPAAPGRAGIG